MHDVSSAPRPVVLTELTEGGQRPASRPRCSPELPPSPPLSFTIRRLPEASPPSWEDLLGER
ncbi:hypothetical protein [Cyanobium sp. NIES-981]|uniref:hypothetical protein n=1 Tax=Cyanobium sp. NIES-981 TaxID=1851505 RepID=UPI0012FA26BB|nr:hypothetical protein [Cyanobium sp. NIES-981]